MEMPGRNTNAGNYRYGFNGQEKSTEINGAGNLYTAEFWEYDGRIGRRWNLDPKPVIGVSEYSAIANNPIWLSDPLGDTIRPYDVAKHLGRDLQGTNSSLDERKIGDYIVKGVYKTDKGNTVGSAIGYQAYKDGRLDYEMAPGDIEAFKNNVKLYSNAADLINQPGASDAMRKIGTGVGSGDIGYALQGVKEENKRAWSDPAFVSRFLLSLGHAGISGVVTKGVSSFFQGGRIAKASELVGYAEQQGWKAMQSAGGPLKYVDKNGIIRMTIKQGSQRAAGSGLPHVELRNALGKRIDAFGNDVTRKSLGNHTEIIYDLK
jgi:hypothetical protein